MASDAVLRRQTAWLFTRDQESVHIEVRSRDGGLRLVVAGPGQHLVTEDFTDIDALDAFRVRFEQDLVQSGFRLQAVTERRGGGEGSRRPGGERRRTRE